ncbi:MAG: serine hydrolase domain-containing protein [Burkholderiaceae bacterium]
MKIDAKALDALLEKMVPGLPGVAACVTLDDQIVYEGAAGARVQGDPAPMRVDTVIWLASMTKAVTAAAVMQLVEQGRLSLDEPAARWLPELVDVQVLEGFDESGEPVLRPPAAPVTLRQLLTHTSGFGYEFLDSNLMRYQQVRGVEGVLLGKRSSMRMPLIADPGASWQYGIGIDFAGLALEAASGMRLGQYLREHLLGPLGMDDTAFRIGDAQRERLARVHHRMPDGSLAVMDFEIEQAPEFEAGGGGLYGTVRDYTRFTRMILGGGELDGVRVLRPETIEQMSRSHIGETTVGKLVSVMPEYSEDAEFMPGIPKGWGLSFLINRERSNEGRSPGSLAWAGLANSYYWIDPSRRLTAVFATQVLPFFDAQAIQGFRAFETAVHRD